jgi:hypothetical protein
MCITCNLLGKVCAFLEQNGSFQSGNNSECLQAHLATCVAREQPCPNDCGNKFESGELACHQNTCPKRPVSCLQCNQSVILSDLKVINLKINTFFTLFLLCIVCGIC